MNEYIEKRKALSVLHLDYKDVIYIDKRETAKLVEAIKGIDIVRCKECKHWDTADGECYADRGIYFPNADDFCSYGERREL